MATDNGNAPAFPGLDETTEIGGPLRVAPGLTKREAFAGMNMAALIARHGTSLLGSKAAAAVDGADALLAELAKREPSS